MPLEELRRLVARHARPDGTTPLDGVLLSKVSRSERPASSTSGTVLAVIVQGAKRLALGDRVYEYRAGQYLVASVDLPVTGHFTEASEAEPALGVGLVLRPPAIAALLSETPPAPAVPAPSGIAVNTASDDLLDALVRLVRLIERPADRAVLAPMIEREILWRLICSDGTVRQLGLADSNLTRVGRAVHWVRAHPAEPFRVEDLARRAGMSVSAFHRNFRAVTALSPIQFQKQIRLQEARLRLAVRPADVARAGREVGYESASQFSRDYRRHFGVPPSQDVLGRPEPVRLVP
ncbi:AraC family transcriptional regulator N-terminal domain-containing protein [Cryptosporangium sp. NPDC051539]|uniref:AraC family transcriptional regulator n=1 Tax=Cryptosporangium sp. NPDC051539 TaxID=3363962 RepID=UPI0037AEBE5A